MTRARLGRGKGFNDTSDAGANVQTYTVGQRVALHAATDEWMQGDRYGEVVGYGHRREYRDRDAGTTAWVRPVRVRLDRSGRVRRFHPTHLFPL